MTAPAPTAQTARHPLTLALKAHLATLERLKVYVGEIGAIGPDDPGPHPPTLANSDRVAPYAVVYPGPGLPDPNPVLSATPTDFLWDVQTTLVAGYSEDLDALLDDVVPLLHLWQPEVAGLDTGPMRHPVGYRPGMAMRDSDVKPDRFFVPLLWQLHVVTSPST